MIGTGIRVATTDIVSRATTPGSQYTIGLSVTPADVVSRATTRKSVCNWVFSHD
jgi:hypothetical protein